MRLAFYFLLMLCCGAVYAVVDLSDKPMVIPENCTVWFDGCNTCQVGEYDEETEQYMLVCTRMYCPPEIQEEPRCLEF